MNEVSRVRPHRLHWSQSMNALDNAAELLAEADEIIHKRGIDDILQSHGKVCYTGSYALDLMAWPDIDIIMMMDDDPLCLDKFFDIGRQVAAVDGVDKMQFWNAVTWDDPNLPRGLYWGLRLNTASRDIPWKMDIWSTGIDEFEKNQKIMARLKGALTEDARKLIVELKYSLITPEGRTPQGSGFYIYEAVLFEGLTEREDILAYVRKQGITTV